MLIGFHFLEFSSNILYAQWAILRTYWPYNNNVWSGNAAHSGPISFSLNASIHLTTYHERIVYVIGAIFQIPPLFFFNPAILIASDWTIRGESVLPNYYYVEQKEIILIYALSNDVKNL